MPVSALQSIADKSGKSLTDIERYWADAKEYIHKSDLDDDDYAYIMSIVKKRAGLAEELKRLFLSEKTSKQYIDFNY